MSLAGAFATRDLEEGEFIAEYCGEIISNKEMKQRNLSKTSEYLFNIGGGLTIDASRFVRHRAALLCSQ